MRGPDGKFLKGTPGGPGRPAKAVERKYAQALRKAVSVADVVAILKRCVEDAKAGDLQAARLVLSYCLGVPTDTTVESRLQELENAQT